jgi:hypothetical protein
VCVGYLPIQYVSLDIYMPTEVRIRGVSISELFSKMAKAMPPLRIIAQPKASYRPRYLCEGRPCRNRAQRFVRADDNPDKFVYPTIEVKFFEQKNR